MRIKSSLESVRLVNYLKSLPRHVSAHNMAQVKYINAQPPPKPNAFYSGGAIQLTVHAHHWITGPMSSTVRVKSAVLITIIRPIKGRRPPLAGHLFQTRGVPMICPE